MGGSLFFWLALVNASFGGLFFGWWMGSKTAGWIYGAGTFLMMYAWLLAVTGKEMLVEIRGIQEKLDRIETRLDGEHPE